MFQWFHNLKLGGKLIVTFAGIIVLTILVSIVALISQDNTQDAVNQLVQVDGQIADLSQSSQTAMLEARRREKDYLLRYKDLGFEDAYATYVTEVQNQAQEIHNEMIAIRALTNEDEIVTLSEDVERAVTEYENTFLATVALIE